MNDLEHLALSFARRNIPKPRGSQRRDTPQEWGRERFGEWGSQKKNGGATGKKGPVNTCRGKNTGWSEKGQYASGPDVDTGQSKFFQPHH